MIKNLFVLCKILSFLINDQICTVSICCVFYNSFFLIPVNYGKGYDGSVYYDMVVNFLDMNYEDKINPYYAQRSLIFGFLHVLFNFFSWDINILSVVSIMQFINLILILLSIFFYYRSCQILNINYSVTIISTSLLFLIFSVLKVSQYYPILTDIPALFGGCLVLYLYLLNKSSLLALITLTFSLIFPTFFYIGSLLLLFPRPKALTNISADKIVNLNLGFNKINKINTYFHINSPSHISPKFKYYWHKYLDYIIFIFVTLLLIFAFAIIYPSRDFPNPMFSKLIPTSHFNLFKSYLSLVCTLLYMWSTLKTLNLSVAIPKFIYNIKYAGVFFCALVYLFKHFLVGIISNSDPPILSLSLYFKFIFLSSLYNPLCFIASHYAYYGLGFVFIFIFYRELMNASLEIGYGLFACLSMFSLLSFATESRQFINVYPIFIFTLAYYFSKYPKVLNISVQDKKRVLNIDNSKIIFMIVSIFGLITSSYVGDMSLDVYFSKQGPWMSDTSYLINIATFFLLYLGIKYSFHRLNSSAPLTRS